MRLAGHTYPFRSLPLEDALDALARIGLHDVELWLGHAPDEEAAASLVAERGLSVVAISSGSISRPDAPEAVAACSLATSVGAPLVAGSLAPGVAGWVEDFLPAGLGFAVENHWDQPLDRAGAVHRLLERHPRLSACLDTGHGLLAGEPPEHAVATLGPRLAHVHLKDGRLPRLYEHALGRRLRRRLLARPAPTSVGDGALDVAALHRALAAAGYEGAVSVEYEGPDPAAALAALVTRWRDITR